MPNPKATENPLNPKHATSTREKWFQVAIS